MFSWIFTRDMTNKTINQRQKKEANIESMIPLVSGAKMAVTGGINPFVAFPNLHVNMFVVNVMSDWTS